MFKFIKPGNDIFYIFNSKPGSIGFFSGKVLSIEEDKAIIQWCYRVDNNGLSKFPSMENWGKRNINEKCSFIRSLVKINKLDKVCKKNVQMG